MNAIPDPKQATPHEIAIAAIKEAYEQIGRREEQLPPVNEQVSKLEQDATPDPSDTQHAYEEQLARVDEQASKLEQDGAPPPSDRQHAFKQEHDGERHPPDHPQTRNKSRPPLPRSLSLGGQAVRAFIALIMAACIGVAAIAWQSPSYRDAARQIIASKAPQLVPILSLIENPGFAEHPRQPTLRAGTANQAPPEPAPLTAPEGVGAPAAAALSRELTQLLQTTARDQATVRQQIEQLKTSQEQMVRANAEIAERLKAAQAQMARDNADLAEQLKAAQAQTARGNAEFAEQLKTMQAQMDRPIVRATEQNLRPQTSAPATRPIATPTRKLAPTAKRERLPPRLSRQQG